MRIKTQDYEDVTVVELHGELTADFVETFRNACSTAVAGSKSEQPTDSSPERRQQPTGSKRRKSGVVLDMTKVGFIDSQGIEHLLWLRDFCRENNCELKLAGLDETCRKILEITRLRDRFDCYAELAEAVKSFA
jgi:anti-anti-sigma factor